MYRWIEHTSELELHVDADTDRAVPEDATRALRELLRVDRDSDGELVERQVTVDADDRAQLLPAWLDELVFLAETQAVVPERVEFDSLDERGLRARATGRR